MKYAKKITRIEGGRPVDDESKQSSIKQSWSWWYLLLLLQFIPTLWVPLFNTVEPTLAGMPFFYWFQLALIFASAAVTAIVYWVTE
jgi:hypothetical protein